MLRILAALTLCLSLAAGPALAQTEPEVDARIDSLLGDHEAFHAAFDAIKAAVAAGDGQALAEYIVYGSPTMVDGKPVTFESEHDFYAAYDGLFTPEIVEAVAAQRYEQLFVNADGVMIGDGQVWLNGICRDEACSAFDVKIVTIQSAN